LPTRSECGLACNIHQSAVIGASGLKIVRGPENQLLKAFHSGQVVIGDRVEIGPNSVVHRAVLSATIIGNDVTIGSLCNIGHNVQIGERSILTVGVSLSGSSSIGADCFIGSGVTVLEGVRVCGKVKIGAGSVVTRDITHPGIYFGSPAKFKGDWDGRW
jgi:UDP-3-O-[3-hydroxymyristoyl] glucosamine N-acyltransferase